MIRIEEGTSPGVVVAEAVGTVTAEDYNEHLIPAIENARTGDEKLRFLLVLGPDFDGYEGGAALEDAKLGIQHWTAFERIGLVTDREPYRVLANALGFLMPGQVRTFTTEDLDEAKAWITA